jgi:maltose operon protein
VSAHLDAAISRLVTLWVSMRCFVFFALIGRRVMDRRLPWFVLGLLLAGCATTREVQLESFAATPSCCPSMREFSYAPLKSGDTLSFKLERSAPAFEFATGKSYFRAFALPEAGREFTVRVQSFMMGDHIDAAYLFFPHVVTLDADYQPVRTLPPEAFELKRASYAETAKETWGLPWKLEGEMPFTAANAAERYLLILTTAELMQRRTSVETLRIAPVIVPGLVTAIPTGKKEVLVPHSPAGHVNLTVLPK